MSNGVILASDGVAEIPNIIDLGSLFAGAIKTVKLGIRNDKDYDANIAASLVQDGTSDMISFIQIDNDVDTISCPFGVTAEPILGNGLTALTLNIPYYYVITAYNATGETGPSQIVTATPVNIPGTFLPQVQLNWSAVASATGYRIYRSTTADFSASLIADIAGTQYIDYGQTTVQNVDAPTANTTGGAAPNYGTPPSGSWVSYRVLDLCKPNEQKFFWLRLNPSALLTEDNNPRSATLHIESI